MILSPNYFEIDPILTFLYLNLGKLIMTEKSTALTQGSALVFQSVDEDSPKLRVELVKERKITPENYNDCFIENHNLQSLPVGCCRVLVAYTQDSFPGRAELSDWNLGVIVNLSLFHTVILPVVHRDNGEFFGVDEVLTVNCFSGKENLTVRYLNRVDHLSVAIDGNVEASLDGPDVVEDSVLSQSLIDNVRKKDNERLYNVRRPTYPISHVRRETEKDCFFDRMNRCRIKTNGVRTIKCTQKERNGLSEGFSFPLIKKGRRKTNIQEFCILDFQSARHVIRLINLNEVTLSQYNLTIEFLAMRKEKYEIFEVEEGIVFEEDSLCRQSLRYQEPGKIDSEGLDPWERKGIIHGMWMPSETVEIRDVEALKYLLKSVYGKYGFQRSVSKCLGLNTYLGKRKASYVRPSPTMSQGAATKSEYHRQDWNPTFHPLVYKLVNALTAQATRFQHLADPIYDKFLLEVVDSILQERNKTKHEANRGTKRKTGAIDKKRFFRVSILTAGNDEICGFANTDHTDGDELDKTFQNQAMKVLHRLEKLAPSSNRGKIMKSGILNHIRSIFLKTNTFHVYTTCGYKIFNSSETKEVYAYFLYNSLDVAVRIPEHHSCYHMFGGKMGVHQTSVPVVLDGDKVRIYDDNIFIFAWGGGGAASSPT